jgi:HlyD family secretion protein
MRWVKLAAFLGVLAAAGYGVWRGRASLVKLRQTEKVEVPVTHVRRGDVTLTVTAKGALQGGNSKMLLAPSTGNPQLTLTALRRSGEPVEKDEVIAEFDTTEELYKQREAEADLAEAGQAVLQATQESLAKEEELEYELIKARSDVKLAELETRRNPLLAGITAKQNDLTLADAKERLQRIEHDYPERKVAATASVAVQEAARKKAEIQAATARSNIEKMTLKAPAAGYVNIEKNTNSNFFFAGMQFPLFQVGDQVRAGMAVAQIPDMDSWEATAQIAESDRGHLAVGQVAEVRVVALPGRVFRAKVVDLGGTTGPPWNRRFECKLSLLAAAPELRPGMSAEILISTDTLKNVLWVPAQAVFERGGQSFVYIAAVQGFQAREVKLVRRSESQVVVEGVKEGERVALANPEERESGAMGGSGGGSGGAMKAMGKT